MLLQKNIIFSFFVCFFSILNFTNESFATSPTQTIHESIDDVIVLLKDPSYKNPTTRLEVRNKIENQVRRVFDFNEFSLRTVGQNWASFTDEEKKRFNDAFAELLLTTYLDKINGYNGEKITYDNEIISTSGDHSEVKTTLNLTDGKTIPIIYRMLSKNNIWVVYDVLIENISLIKNYRSQFQDLLLKGTPDALIIRVQERAKELKNASLNNNK